MNRQILAAAVCASWSLMASGTEAQVPVPSPRIIPGGVPTGTTQPPPSTTIPGATTQIPPPTTGTAPAPNTLRTVRPLPGTGARGPAGTVASPESCKETDDSGLTGCVG